MSFEEEIRARRVSSPEAPIEQEVQIDNPVMERVSGVESSATGVMASYQNANKWLDIIKEELLMTHGCVFFSNHIHELAHTMPERFDKFGDILHTANMKVPYPATGYIPFNLEDMNSIFNAIFEILDSINESLRDFIKINQDSKYHSMASVTEELLIDIDSEYTNLYRFQKAYHMSNSDIIKFDKWVSRYMREIDNLID